MRNDLMALPPEVQHMAVNWVIIGFLVLPMIYVVMRQAFGLSDDRRPSKVAQFGCAVIALFSLVWLYSQVDLATALDLV